MGKKMAQSLSEIDKNRSFVDLVIPMHTQQPQIFDRWKAIAIGQKSGWFRAFVFNVCVCHEMTVPMAAR